MTEDQATLHANYINETQRGTLRARPVPVGEDRWIVEAALIGSDHAPAYFATGAEVLTFLTRLLSGK